MGLDRAAGIYHRPMSAPICGDLSEASWFVLWHHFRVIVRDTGSWSYFFYRDKILSWRLTFYIVPSASGTFGLFASFVSLPGLCYVHFKMGKNPWHSVYISPIIYWQDRLLIGYAVPVFYLGYWLSFKVARRALAVAKAGYSSPYDGLFRVFCRSSSL